MYLLLHRNKFRDITAGQSSIHHLTGNCQQILDSFLGIHSHGGGRWRQTRLLGNFVAALHFQGLKSGFENEVKISAVITLLLSEPYIPRLSQINTSPPRTRTIVDCTIYTKRYSTTVCSSYVLQYGDSMR